MVEEITQLQSGAAIFANVRRETTVDMARLAFEECLLQPGNCSLRLKLSAALEYLHRCQ